ILYISARKQILLLGGHQLRTIDSEQWLAFTDELVGCVRVNVSDPARITGLHVSETAFVNVNRASRANLGAEGLNFRFAGLYAYGLNPLRGQLHRRVWLFYLRHGRGRSEAFHRRVFSRGRGGRLMAGAPLPDQSGCQHDV